MQRQTATIPQQSQALQASVPFQVPERNYCIKFPLSTQTVKWTAFSSPEKLEKSFELNVHVDIQM
jgi:hypothetical protein